MTGSKAIKERSMKQDDESKELTLMENENLPTIGEVVTPMQMLQIAVQKGTDLAQIEKLMELEREWKADRAREAFVAAMSGFRGEAVEVLKTRRVTYTTDKGTTDYMHAELAHAVQAAVPALSKWGLSHRWETSQADGLITVRCIVTHKLGHSESTVLQASPDSSGGKNNIQAIGSTITYLERYTFLAATGLAAKSMDNDAGLPVEKINEEQLANLEALITEVNADRAAFLKYCKIDQLENLPVSQYKTAIKALERKRNEP